MAEKKSIQERLIIKAGIISMGEKIQFGSDTALMYEAAEKINQLELKVSEMQSKLERVSAIEFQTGEMF